MKRISQAELKRLESSGTKVHRKMGTGTKPVAAAKPAAPKKEVPMASMQVSMQHLEEQAQATQKVIASNTEVIDEFRKGLSSVVEKVQQRVPYVFDVERGKNLLIERIIATPQLK